MHSKKDIQLKETLTGKWGQFMDSRKTGVHLALALALLVIPALPAWASSEVTAANYSSNAAGDVVITLSTDGDDPNVSVFATESPARIVLDLADTNSQVDANPDHRYRIGTEIHDTGGQWENTCDGGSFQAGHL